MLYRILLLSLFLSAFYLPVSAQDKAEVHPLAGLPFRLIGPAYPSGRISDFAVHPDGPHHYYAATASGNLWKTDNAGTTWTPLFERQGSYAIGKIALDPQNPNTLWVGTGENNAQRSVAKGDGVYVSHDAGRTWSHKGLKDSGHISGLWIDPADSAHILVAAQGPLWSAGGDRGLYESTDAGETWLPILQVNEYTGINEFAVHPKRSGWIVASAYQRARRVYTLVNGGPGSGLHFSRDGGKSWQKAKAGLPKGIMGRIGIAMSPARSDRVYAIIEGEPDQQGVYMSEDFGRTWAKQSSHMTTSPQYYNELVADPKDPDILYSLDTRTAISTDAGKSWSRLSTNNRHVDDHALFINPANTAHLIIGGDGGVYESYDRGSTWRHFDNLPITQFYRVAVDQEAPFYNVCGGTQDNNSLCGPSETTSVHGITNRDWRIILGGDGYEPQIDPTDPNIIYTQLQYGGLARYDRRTAERLFIAPQAGSGEPAYKFNWNTPLLISPHDPKTIYYAAEKVFRSTNRGDDWEVISPDLTRQLDVNDLAIMGRIWGPDAIAKNSSTSKYGSLIAFEESPLVKDLLYAGSDDGVISVSENGGKTWASETVFSGVPEMSLVEDIIASLHDPDRAYAVFDNHKRGDDGSYILVTQDRGLTWQPLTDTPPAKGPVHVIIEDHEDPDLLFAGTELGLYFSTDRGQNWTQFTGLPTTSVRDLDIQRREDDLVVGTFGRGIYVLDDYSALRTDPADLDGQELVSFAMRDALLYIKTDHFGTERLGYRGAEFWSADNPAYGAVFSYYLSEGLESRLKARRAEEAKKARAGEDNPYPAWESLRDDRREDEPSLFLSIRDAQGTVVRRLKAPSSKGFHRLAWNMRHESPDRVTTRGPQGNYWSADPIAPLALPGSYTAQLVKREKDRWEPVGDEQSFTLTPLDLSPETTDDRPALLAFQQDVAAMIRRTDVAAQTLSDYEERVEHLGLAMLRTPAADEADYQAIRSLSNSLADLRILLSGDPIKAEDNAATPLGLQARVQSLVLANWLSQAPVGAAHARRYDTAKEELAGVMADLASAREVLRSLEARLDRLGAPATPGREPR